MPPDPEPERSSQPKSSAPQYSWRDVHADLENYLVIGTYGAANAPYLGIAAKKAKVDLKLHHQKKHPDEILIPSLAKHVQSPEIQKHWTDIFMFDPLGMTANQPTIAATTAHMSIPELLPELKRDGKIVRKDGSINVIKAAIEWAWNLPELSKNLKMTENDLRDALFEYSSNPDLKDKSKRTYLPPVGGVTVYIFGDLNQFTKDPLGTEIAVRTHDECNGSDVFGTDICTCRPYLIFSLQGCIECAQRGGVGILAYFRKEGRSLGEVVKFRVYNARKNQEGGDRPEKYFYQTEAIAGIRDARFQVMMPDVLCWLGVSRIDWFFSMSDEKYNAIIERGISVMQRVSLPDEFVPENAHVEITAKISAGYHTDNIHSSIIVEELRRLETIRAKCMEVFELAKLGQLIHFDMNLEKLPEAVKHTTETISKFYPKLDIPFHSRLRHFGTQRISKLTESWPCDKIEKVRRLIDLVTISVLLDAGAGPDWHYLGRDGNQYIRSEGLAIGSLDMFVEGEFSSDPALPCRVNSHGLRCLTLHSMEKGFQVTEANPMVGLQGRCRLLKNLGRVMGKYPEYFGPECQRPGNLVDYVTKHVDESKTVSIRVLWKALVDGLGDIWPTTILGVRRGDVWSYTPLKKIGKIGSDLIPFHKLSQWLLLSLLEPLQMLGFKFTEMHLVTALAEYRNGGLLVDTGILIPKRSDAYQREFNVGSEIIVEWRALTIILLDMIAEEVRKFYKKTEDEMPLPMILEGGTWRAGRLLAGQLRDDCSPPIKIRSDGTVF